MHLPFLRSSGFSTMPRSQLQPRQLRPLGKQQLVVYTDTIFKYCMIHPYIIVYVCWDLFVLCFGGLNPTKEGLFQPKQGSFGLQVYNVYIYIIYIYHIYIYILELRSKLCSWGIGHVQTGWSPIGGEGFEFLEFSLSEMIKVSEAVPLRWGADLLSTLGCLLTVCFI